MVVSHDYVILDVETAADEAVLPLLDEPTPAANLKDPDKIAADLMRKREDQRDRMSLDPFAGRIVCLGCHTESGVSATICRDEEEERYALHLFADRVVGSSVTPQAHVIGFNVAFDLAWVMTRARLLGVPFPTYDLRRYNTPQYTDLLTLLTCNGLAPDGALKRTLQRVCQRFGIPVADPTTGADIAQLVREERWADVQAHCLSDLRLTAALAQRLGVITAMPSQVSA